MTSLRPIFLIGSQRSGSTALAAVLNRAVGLKGGMFTINGKLPYLLNRWLTRQDLNARHFRADEVIWALRRKTPRGRGVENWLVQTERSLRRTAEHVAAGTQRGPIDIRRQIVREAYGSTDLFGDKYNEYMLELSALYSCAPEAHWVLIVRHPVDVAASMLDWSGDRPWRPRTFEDAMEKWIAWHKPWMNWSPRESQTLTVVEYRSMCTSAGLGRLGSILDLDLDSHSNMMRVSNRGTACKSKLRREVDETWSHLLSQASE